MSILGGRLTGAKLLDLFAGSGALGLEALSRGAAHVTFVELAAPSLAAIRSNIETLGVADRVTVHRGDALRFVGRISPGAFDIVVADPPYTIPFAEQLVELFRARPFTRLLAVEHPIHMTVGGDETRRYGDIALTFCYAP
jgi:16S rRNA (guanine966-N2)-methyltransferase